MRSKIDEPGSAPADHLYPHLPGDGSRTDSGTEAGPTGIALLTLALVVWMMA
ncbi:hypothetical protein ADINL_0866 [Nitrincola lacisaponensis]|uniref:Uncharacterized protein n=1 Tax=Nitrincola lacisaponensis TaxID=267850 RepID=A0A063Y3K9_9GAMM|nr:hypothetical protein ADINL_0866 [Nitrincola lacisaponensis]